MNASLTALEFYDIYLALKSRCAGMMKNVVKTIKQKLLFNGIIYE